MVTMILPSSSTLGFSSGLREQLARLEYPGNCILGCRCKSFVPQSPGTLQIKIMKVPRLIHLASFCIVIVLCCSVSVNMFILFILFPGCLAHPHRGPSPSPWWSVRWDQRAPPWQDDIRSLASGWNAPKMQRKLQCCKGKIRKPMERER